jgi:CBS domain containing-hemolysin-like protein
MDDPLALVLKIAAVIALVAINGFFVAAEFALVKVRGTQLRPLIQQGNRRAAFARRVVDNLDASLSACQLGITLASLALGWIGEPLFAAMLAPVMDWMNIGSSEIRHSISFVVGITTITFLHVTAGEQAPKLLAIQKPIPTSLRVARPLLLFHRVSYPFIWALNTASTWMLRRAGIQMSSEHQLTHTDDELKLLVAGTAPSGSRQDLGRSIVLNAFDLSHRLAREVMRPRGEIVALDAGATIEECCEVARRTRFSRFPLCENADLDRTLGVVHIKDLYDRQRQARTGRDLLPAVHRILYIPETARLERLLQFFLERRLHLAIVVDEYGGTVGMVTLENVLEELVGQIQDEFDQEKPLINPVSDGVWTIDGALPLHELAELTGESFFSEGISTTSGWVTERLGGFAKVGDVVTLDRHELRVEQMDGLRAATLRVSRIQPQPADFPSI